MRDNITIGILAKRSGVNVETVRYYQRRGLLDEPSKPSRGFRRYPQQAVARVLSIKKAKYLGFTLEEILVLLSLDGKKACSQTRAIAAYKLEMIEQKIKDLSKLKKSLSHLVHTCDASPKGATCPILRFLTED